MQAVGNLAVAHILRVQPVERVERTSSTQTGTQFVGANVRGFLGGARRFEAGYGTLPSKSSIRLRHLLGS